MSVSGREVSGLNRGNEPGATSSRTANFPGPLRLRPVSSAGQPGRTRDDNMTTEPTKHHRLNCYENIDDMIDTSPRSMMLARATAEWHERDRADAETRANAFDDANDEGAPDST